MKISEIVDLLDAECLTGTDMLEKEVKTACGSDMMSDVLAFAKDNAVLMTGLCNPQVIRTAEMLDTPCVIFVRSKRPTQAMIDMAEEREIVVLATNHRMFSTCGILFQAGLTGGEK